MNDDNNQDDINQVPASSPNLKTELAKKLQELVPEAITDGKVDTKKLKELLDDDTADDSERFGLFWPGKKRAMRAAQEPTTATLIPSKEESKDWDTTQNIFIEGDNLEVLKILQKHYHNKIKMIYIDPPYNTGKDFVYPDNYKEGLQSYLEFTKQVNEKGKKISTNSDTDGRYHSNWLNMMYPRLKLARNLLAEDGAIFVSIGVEEIAHLKKLMDEIFGEGNFVEIFSWVKTSTPPALSTKSRKTNEYILCYEKSWTSTKYNGEPLDGGDQPLLNSGNAIRDLKFPAGSILFNGNKFPDGEYGPVKPDRVELLNTIHIESGRSLEEVVLRGEFKWTQEFLDQEISSGTVFVVKSESLSIRFTRQEEGFKRPTNFIKDAVISPLINKKDSGVETNEKASSDLRALMGMEAFDFPKPVSLISYLANFITGQADLILDFFSGSGTTAHAIMQLNADDGGERRHIQIQLPEPTEEKSEAYKAGYKNISDISKERIRRAGEKIKKDYADKLAERDKPLDVGFKVFKLADTNFSKWHTSSDTDVDAVQQTLLEMRESADDSASQEDLLTEILLKLGFSLTTRASKQTIAGLDVWSVGENALLAYLDEHTKPTLDQLRELAQSEPVKLVVLEDAFQGDDELKTNLVQICKTHNIELWTV